MKNIVLLLSLFIVMSITACSEAIETPSHGEPLVTIAADDTAQQNANNNETAGQATNNTGDDTAEQDVADDTTTEQDTENTNDIATGEQTTNTADTTAQANGSAAVRVERIVDGDTFVLASGERVRLIGIDTPEIGEAGAAEATAFLSDLVLNQYVWLTTSGNDTDRFGRLRRYVWLNEPIHENDIHEISENKVNALLLLNGHAVPMILGGGSAWIAQLNLPAENGTSGEQAADTAAQAPITAFIGNRNSQIFHLPTCTTLPAEHNRVHFETREAALAAGHRACNRCNP